MSERRRPDYGIDAPDVIRNFLLAGGGMMAVSPWSGPLRPTLFWWGASWVGNAEDLSGNAAEATRRNAELEGVAARLELKTEDARKMSFADETFDVILSNLALHNIYDAAGRARSCREIARVLKSGGVALISDFRHTAQYADELAKAGLEVRRGAPRFLDTFPPLRVVEAVKKAA